MDRIKIKDAATEQGMKPEELVARLREAGIEKTVKGSLSPEEYEKVKVKKSEASVEVVRKDVIIRRRSKPAAAEAPAAPVVEEKAAPAVAETTAAAPEAAPVEAKAAPAAEKAPRKARAPREAAPVARIVRPARVVTEAPVEARVVEAPAPAAPEARVVEKPAEKAVEKPAAVEKPVEKPAEKVVEKPVQEVKAAPAAEAPAVEARQDKAPRARKVEVPAARIVTPKPAPVQAAPVREEKPAQEVKAAPSAEVKSEAPRGDRPRRAPAASAEPEGSSQPSLLPPVQERRHTPEEGEGEDARKKAQSPATEGAPRVRVISRPDPTQARIVRPASPSEGRSGRDGDSRRDGGRRDMRDSRAPRPDAREGRDGDSRDRDGRDRDNRRSSGNRPSGGRSSGGAPFTPPFGQQPPMEGEQSRKKRNNKSRRSVDFPQDSDDFSRRHGGPDMDDDEGMVRTRRSHKPKKQQHQAPSQSTQPMKAAKRKIRVEESIRVADMAHQMGVKSSEIIKILFGLGVMATINNALDIDTATLVASEFGYEVEKVGFSEEAYLLPATADTPEMLKPRPPVVTIMGHVDHGKTSLLDAIRKTSVTSGEAGGITQHIGAYHVKTKRGDIVFLDTPGHAAFTAMRARGAQVTDLVVLVVAADDGVMEQTREAINHSRAAGVPILVAVNKIDKETANPDRVLRELSELGLQPEEWGGDTVVGMVSAKTGKGLDDLLELIALQAEILELKANPDKPARGHVVEAKLDKGRGPVATVLVQEGTLHQGDVFVCGVFSGRVRALFNDQGRKIKEAGPSMPVEIQGFEGVPEAGEEFVCLDDEKTARRIAESRATKLREKELAKVSRVTLENFLKQSADAQETQVLNVVLKADVQGSLEAITESLRKLSTEKVRIDIIHGGAGAISESDVMLAAASNAIIIGFNVRPTAKVKEVAEQEQVDIRFYDIIYKLVDEIKSAMAGLLAPVSKEVYLGQAEVRQTFSVPKVGLIAGCMVTDGKLTRTANVRLLRDGVVVYTGKISSLKRLKDDAREVVRNLECGVGLENFHDIKIGDVIEAFELVEEAASLD
ncbi:translation initiation factor IF-2 [uncultured Mailhella sp.]|uniref:translation initiation factor IF-2 n=1 Tax=uncultured Mailhella sp. TaxID=1981031 RepID=UPI0025F77F2C|nr:translation initiation factor IF-2 [uncultured Mailhella sp.]